MAPSIPVWQQLGQHNHPQVYLDTLTGFFQSTTQTSIKQQYVKGKAELKMVFGKWASRNTKLTSVTSLAIPDLSTAMLSAH